MIMGRVAHLTTPTSEHLLLGRGRCQARNHCHLGCSYGAYFSTNSATLPAAQKTGNLTLVPDAIVTKLIQDKDTGRITQVQVLDANTKAATSYSSKIVFLNASTIATTLILLGSAHGGWHKGVGKAFKDKNRQPGDWTIMLDAFGECLPRENNTITAHKNKTDKWGQPIAVIDLTLGENDKKLIHAAHADAIDMLTSAGAKELCERGLKTLVLERGKDIDPAKDYSDMLDPWDKKFLDRVRPEEAQRDYARQKDVYVFFESTKHLWVKDSDHPYETARNKDYEWYRGYQVGGRSLLWARMSYRLSDHDFGLFLWRLF